ncbi:hypothetical protein O6H91_01G122300 [Diphasiastrum complanatum]|uniref:Uncharacterized protein n=1 Tax=Diphasiastrum complanatum TaxID=34168 RepID=A0ACC2EVK6_DIPCM|nr:hypothetical protein O6H91_01G122300 [Diphasiastrum complanatum]
MDEEVIHKYFGMLGVEGMYMPFDKLGSIYNRLTSWISNCGNQTTLVTKNEHNGPSLDSTVQHNQESPITSDTLSPVPSTNLECISDVQIDISSTKEQIEMLNVPSSDRVELDTGECECLQQSTVECMAETKISTDERFNETINLFLSCLDYSKNEVGLEESEIEELQLEEKHVIVVERPVTEEPQVPLLEELEIPRMELEGFLPDPHLVVDMDESLVEFFSDLYLAIDFSLQEPSPSTMEPKPTMNTRGILKS